MEDKMIKYPPSKDGGNGNKLDDTPQYNSRFLTIKDN
jgi:hypothetical protein